MRNEALGKLSLPAIGLLGGAALNLPVGLLFAAAVVFGYSEEEILPIDPREKFGFPTARVGIFVI